MVMIQAWIPEIIDFYHVPSGTPGEDLFWMTASMGQGRRGRGSNKTWFQEGCLQLWQSQQIPSALRREKIKKPSDCFFVRRKPALQASDPLKCLTAYSPRSTWTGTQGTPGTDWPPCSDQEVLLPSWGSQRSPSSLRALHRFNISLDWRKNLRKEPKIMGLLLQIKENLRRASSLETGLDWVYPLCK